MLPPYAQFGPQGEADAAPPIRMTVDEFECIRLIDLADMTQEACALQMDVARTTVQSVYNSARKKLAACLVQGRALVIEGGPYTVCDGRAEGCPRARQCCRRQAEQGATPADGSAAPDNTLQNIGRNRMKIAVTYENGQVFQHFGHSEQFKVYTVENNAVVGSEVVATNGSGHGALAGLLQGLGVDTLICGGIGGGARQALAAANIRLFGGVTGSADDAVHALLSDSLVYQPDVLCNHHGAHHGECGEHGRGEHHHHCGD